MTSAVDGLVSGLSTSQLISQLMSIEKQPQVRLQNQQATANSLLKVQQQLNTLFSSVKDAADALADAADWAVTTASSSNTAVATTATSTGALPGTLSFTVSRLATAHAIVSSGSVAGTSAVIATPGSRMVVATTKGLGFSALSASSGLALGSHTIAVTQASAGATATGTALASSITIGSGATLEVALDGSTATTKTITLTAGTYTRDQLAAMVTSASGGDLTATVSNSGALVLTTTREGSAAQLAVTGGTGTADLGLSLSAAAAAGTDGIVKVGTTTTTLTDLNAGGTVTLDAGSGESLTATLTGGVRTGTEKVGVVDLGTGSLSAVVSAVNKANAGVTAGAVQVAPGQYRLQLTATDTGAANAITLDTSAITGMGTLQTVSEPLDALLTVGSGTNAYTITSASNTATVMPGVTATLLKTDPSPVTVSVTNDAATMATRVKKLVDAVNSANGFIKQQSSYDATTKKAGPLLGEGLARNLQASLYGVFGGSTSTGATALATLGISVQRDGTYTFDSAKFTDAYTADPNATAAAFTKASAVVTGTTDGLAKRLSDAAKAATDSISGSITTAVSGTQARIKSLDKQIAAWDPRLAIKEATLQRKFSGLETSLSNMKNQSTWLSGQIAKL